VQPGEEFQYAFPIPAYHQVLERNQIYVYV
jgi:hypothetical protein